MYSKFCWVLPSTLKFDLVLLGFTEFFPSFTRFNWNFPRCYQVLPSCTGFLSDFTAEIYVELRFYRNGAVSIQKFCVDPKLLLS